MLGFGFRCKSLCLKVPIKCKMYLAKPCDFHRKWSMRCQNQLLFPRNSIRVILLYSCIISRKCGKAMTTSKKKTSAKTTSKYFSVRKPSLCQCPFIPIILGKRTGALKSLGQAKFIHCAWLSASLWHFRNVKCLNHGQKQQKNAMALYTCHSCMWKPYSMRQDDAREQCHLRLHGSALFSGHWEAGLL